MDISALHNPYDYGNPVRDGRMFAGRHDELSRIAYTFDQAGVDRPVGYIALHGDRAAGKTSLLNMAQALADKRGYLTVRVDLVEGDADPVVFFAKLYEELVASISAEVELTTQNGAAITGREVRRVIHGAVRDDFPLELPESLAQAGSGGRMSDMALRTDLRLFVEHLGRPIVLLIDEAQIVADRRDVLSVLRTVGMQIEGYVFVLAGTSDLVKRIHDVFDQLLRQFELIKVERFTESSEVTGCMAGPLSALGLHAHDCFSDFHDVASDLWQLTDGNPYEIQFFCHVMFSRWQTGAARQMELSPETLDSVLEVMDAGDDGHERPLVFAVRNMSPQQLLSLNVLCSSIGHGTVDEIWFAHCLPGSTTLTRAEFDRHVEHFLSDGTVEIEGGVVKLTRDPFGRIYARLWALKKLDQWSHPQLISGFDFRWLLTSRLAGFLRDCTAQGPAKVLRTCCYGLEKTGIDACISQLETLPEGVDPSMTIEFLHEALVRCGFPAALDITSVECSYDGTTAVRWLYTPDTDDFELTTLPGFADAVTRVAELGGSLRADKVRLATQPWPRIREWLANNATRASKNIANFHVRISFETYADGDVAGAIEHLSTAFAFASSWEPANNLAYLCLTQGMLDKALQWADTALELTTAPEHLALSRYNAAMALLCKGELAAAQDRLAAARSDIAPMATAPHFGFLQIPYLADGGPALREQTGLLLSEAIDTATELVELSERYASLQESGKQNPVPGGDEVDRPTRG